MLKSYGDLISKLLENVLNGKTEVSLLECLKIAGNGIVLMLILAVLILVVAGIFLFPTKTYTAFVGKTKDALNSLLMEENPDDVQIAKMRRSMVLKRIVFAGGFFIFYIPVCIPMVLYLISLLCY